MIKKIVSFVLAFLLVCPSAVGAIGYDVYMDGRNEYMSATYEISPGLSYTEILSDNEKYGIQRSFVYEYTTGMGTEIVPAYNGHIYGTYSLGTLAEMYEAGGNRVVGGINGDFYIMSTGVPLGAMIVDGEIITSDSGYLALGFDAEGKAFISKPNIITTISKENAEISVGHINKTPSEYSLYLLTDKFASTTKSTLPTAEIVLAPYSSAEIIKSESDMPENSSVSDDTERSDDISEKDTEQEEYFYIYSSDIEESTEQNDVSDVPETEDIISAEDVGDAEDIKTDEKDDDEITENLIPSTEKTESESELQDVGDSDAASDSEIEAADGEKDLTAEENKIDYFAKKYTVSDEKLKIGSNIKAVIKEIRYDSQNSEIPEGCFVLTAENAYQLYRVSELSVGDEITISVTADEGWENIDNAIGVYGGYILRDGQYCDDVEIDHYPYAHPRTAVGVTDDGRMIFYCVDGRQKSSGGLRIDQLSHEMKNLGCVTAVNLDGGGSTTAYAALPGEKTASLKNSPSGIYERKTANSLLFLNTSERKDQAERYSIYPQSPYVIGGGSKYTIEKPKATDINFHPIDIPDDTKYEYFVSDEDSDSVIIDGNIFVSGEKNGAVDIGVRIYNGEEFSEYPAGSIFVLSTPESFSLGDDKYTISPFETVKLTFEAEYHTGKIYYENASLRWALPGNVTEESVAESDITEENEDDITDPADENLLTEGMEVQVPSEQSQDGEISEDTEMSDETVASEDTEYIAMSGDKIETDKLIVSDDLVITPKTHGEELVIGVKLGELEKSITVNVLKFPFNDSFAHWSAKNLYSVNTYGLMQGEPDGDEFAFRPERNLTKAEFLTVLARMLYPDIDKIQETDRQDQAVDETEVPEISETETSENEIVDTQPTEEEQLSANTEDHPDSEDALLVSEEVSKADVYKQELGEIFADTADIPEWALKYYGELLHSGLLGIIADYDEYAGVRLLPNEYITREEVLVVMGALCEETEVDFVSAFTDGTALADSKFFGFINNAVATGIFEGYEDGTLRPSNNLTRAEAATVILRFCDNVFLK